jgi:aerobic C4-dicarboxylate transport protein
MLIIPDIPIQSIAILLGIDKFMSACRVLTGTIGNGVATIVVSRWEHQLGAEKLKSAMVHPIALGTEIEIFGLPRSEIGMTSPKASMSW